MRDITLDDDDIVRNGTPSPMLLSFVDQHYEEVELNQDTSTDKGNFPL